METEKDGSDLVKRNQTTVERKSDRELVVTRAFNASARIVFDAWTKPELLLRWWAPRSRGVKLFSCEIDLSVGGKYRYVFGREGQTKFAFSGTYLEVERPKRLVLTQLFEQIPQAGEAIVIATFDEKGGKTHLVLHEQYPSNESLDGAMQSGMEDGMRETLEQLEDLLAESKTRLG